MIIEGMKLAEYELAQKDEDEHLSKHEFKEQLQLAEQRTSVSLVTKVLLGIAFSISVIELLLCFMIQFHMIGFLAAIITQIMIDYNIYYTIVKPKQ